MLWCPRHEGCLRCPQRGSGQAVSDGICAKGGEAIFIQTDCSSTAAIKELVDKTVAHYGKLDGVVSNAGIGMGGTPLHEYDVTDYEKIFALNSEGVFAGMKYGAEAILKSHSEGGFLINVASIAGLVPQRGQALYSATKFGVVGMTRAAALDYAATASRSTPSAPATPKRVSSATRPPRQWISLLRTAPPSAWATRRNARHWHCSLPAIWRGISPAQHPGGRCTFGWAPEHQQLEAPRNPDGRQAEQPKHDRRFDGK